MEYEKYPQRAPVPRCEVKEAKPEPPERLRELIKKQVGSNPSGQR